MQMIRTHIRFRACRAAAGLACALALASFVLYLVLFFLVINIT